MPDYAVLLAIFTTLFLAVSLTAMVSHGLTLADVAPDAKRRFGITLGVTIMVWVALVGALSYSGAVEPNADRAFPTLGILILGSAILGNVMWARSATAQAVLKIIPSWWLAAIQLYRIVRVVFILLAADGILPNYFAQTTGWGDIAVGLAAPFVALLLWIDERRFRYFAVIWCVAGIADLLTVLFKALLTAPGPMQIDIDIPTVIIGQFPFAFIPLLVVPISLILHVQLMRKLLGATKA